MKPFVMQCDDYHDFRLVQLVVNAAIDGKSKFKEITLLYDDNGEEDPYSAIFYVGKCPVGKCRIKTSELKKLGISVYES